MKKHQSLLKRYSAYKDSGIEWIEELPTDWRVKRLKEILREVVYGTSEKTKELGKYEVLRMGDIDEGRVSFPKKRFIDNVPKELLLKQGDLLFNRTNSLALVGKVGLIEQELKDVIFASYLIRLRLNNNQSNRYFWYFLNSEYFIRYSRSNAIQTANQANLSSSKLKQFKVIHISPSLQKSIAHYLDTKTAQIDRKIDLLTQKATLYSNLKQSLINETVTRGLDKTVPMSDRRIGWIGEVPEHWQKGRIKDFTESNNSVKIPIQLSDTDLVEFMPMTNIDEELGKIKEFNLVPLKDVSNGYTKFRNGDVIFAKITPCMENGNVALVSKLRHDVGFGSTEFMVFRPFKKLSARYLRYFLHNVLFRKNAEPFMKGTAGQKRLTSLYTAIHYLGLPPLTEQKAIADYLDTKTAKIDQIIQTINTQIERLKELRKTLINDVVTGKIKVVENEH